MFGKEQDISIDEIIHTLKEGEKTYRGMKRGIEVAQAFKSLEGRSTDLKKENQALEDRNVSLKEEVQASDALVQSNITKARKIISDTEDEVAKLKSVAQVDILAAQNRADDELKAAASRLAAVNEEIQEESVKRDTIRAEISELNTEKEKIRQKLLDGTA
jgi:DNA repair exonuclease SbcCD ATPase subunit